MALTAQEQMELDQLEKRVGSAAPVSANPSGGLSAQEEAELAHLEQQVGHAVPKTEKLDPMKLATLENSDPVHFRVPIIGTDVNIPSATSRENVQGLLNGKFRDSGRIANSPGEFVDSLVGSPVRTGISDLQNGMGIIPTAKHAVSSLGKDPSNAPTGADIAVDSGIKNPYLGAGVATAVDLGAQLPVGLLAKGGGKALGAVSEAGGNWLKDLAETRAFKSLGPVKRFEDANQAKGLVNSIGRTALDEGVVTPLASKKTMLNRADALADKKSGELQGLLNEVSQSKNLSPEQAESIQSSKFIPAEAAEGLKGKIKQEYSELPPEIVEPRLKMVDQWLSSRDPKDIQQTQNFKTQMQKFIKDSSFYKDNPGAAQDVLLGVRNAAKEGIEKNADAYANVLGEPGGKVRDTNRSLGNALEMGNILEDRISRNGANRSLSPSDYASGIIGEHALGPFGLLAAGANKFAREKGSQLMATGANRMSNMLLESPSIKALAEKDPKLAEEAILNLVRETQMSGKAAKAADNKVEKKNIAGQ